jgi:hypothetical protein
MSDSWDFIPFYVLFYLTGKPRDLEFTINLKAFN